MDKKDNVGNTVICDIFCDNWLPHMIRYHDSVLQYAIKALKARKVLIIGQSSYRCTKFTSLSSTFSQVVWLIRLLVNTSHQKNIHIYISISIAVLRARLCVHMYQQAVMPDHGCWLITNLGYTHW